MSVCRAEYPNRAVSFTNVEGNAAPEGCLLSRQFFQYPHADPETFLEDFIVHNWSSPYSCSPLQATSVRHKVRAGAVRGIFESMVEFSDTDMNIRRFGSHQYCR